LDLKP